MPILRELVFDRRMALVIAGTRCAKLDVRRVVALIDPLRRDKVRAHHRRQAAQARGRMLDPSLSDSPLVPRGYALRICGGTLRAYFEVDDLAEALRRVQALGGSVVHPGERWAVCKDSEGSPFGLAARPR
jgi:hypothetical protein